MNPRTEQMRFVILFDRDFEVSAGSSETEGMENGLVISNQQHVLVLKCRTSLDAIQWKAAILESMNSVGRIWLQNHPYGSSFPVRRSQNVQWFVDGRSFMEHAANMMELAREEIFIADWWLSPEIFMKRPAVEGNRWRLDEILKRKAEQGVRIFVLLYKEMEMALGINSIYTKRTLQTLHENIKVLRHPDHYLSSGTFFWAHHEKLIVIDQLIAFVGGIDLCFDFIDRYLTPRMPWHDIHACTYGTSARDIARHFIQRWNATKTEKSKELKEYPFLLPKSYDTVKVPRVLETYSNLADVQAYVSLIANAQHYIYIENQFFVSIIDSDDVRNEICKVLCERIKRAYRDRAKFRVYIMLPLLPGFEGEIGAPGGSALQAVLHWTYKSLSRGPDSLIESLKRYIPDPMEYIHIGSLRTYETLSGKLEHLGLLPEQKRKPPKREIDLDDPVADSFFFDTWVAIAKKNTEIFEQVFNVIPTDKLKDFEDVQMYIAKLPLSETMPQVAEEYLRGLIGNLVEFPLDFLVNANLAPGLATKEGIVPSSVFT
ncbi:phospholipase D domain protein [Onchocerca flexuosa]|uniref:phospholipase D n=1 Tax=Onchocerca flexuosa TaxID=387005 RepID=A0A238BKR7_9BILA|nr:phospholipase D domain protein [Onchocerca flexuosa]